MNVLYLYTILCLVWGCANKLSFTTNILFWIDPATFYVVIKYVEKEKELKMYKIAKYQNAKFSS